MASMSASIRLVTGHGGPLRSRRRHVAPHTGPAASDLGMTIITINVRMEKNRPSIPHPSGLRPFVKAMRPQTTAAITLPTATKIPLIPRRMNPAATGSEVAKTTACNMSSPIFATTNTGISW
jgi:hypothetical protein